MTIIQDGAHGIEAPPVAGDPSTFPPHAELVRTLLGHGGFGSLTTTTPDGYPYGSLAAFSVVADGSLLLCISDIAEHTQNARGTSRAGMFVGVPHPTDGDPLDQPRVSLIGNLIEYPASRNDIDQHLALHPQTSAYMHFDDFAWWRLQVERARFVGGFGTMSWVDGPAIGEALIDPVLPHAQPAIDHMNADHRPACLAMARTLAGLADATGATIDAIDRHGLTLSVDTAAGSRTARLGFLDGPLESAKEIRAAVVALAQAADSQSEPANR